MKNGKTPKPADLFPPLCVKFSCRASARPRKFALIGEKISHRWAFRQFSNKAYPESIFGNFKCRCPAKSRFFHIRTTSPHWNLLRGNNGGPAAYYMRQRPSVFIISGTLFLSICEIYRARSVKPFLPSPVKKSAVNPTTWFTAESEEIPRPAQFSPQGGNGAVRGISELERATRLELATSTLARWRSTR